MTISLSLFPPLFPVVAPFDLQDSGLVTILELLPSKKIQHRPLLNHPHPFVLSSHQQMFPPVESSELKAWCKRSKLWCVINPNLSTRFPVEVAGGWESVEEKVWVLVQGCRGSQRPKRVSTQCPTVDVCRLCRRLRVLPCWRKRSWNWRTRSRRIADTERQKVAIPWRKEGGVVKLRK